MIGVELVENKETRAPINPEVFLKIWENCKDLGVLLGKGGFYGNVSGEKMYVIIYIYFLFCCRCSVLNRQCV